jgi:hypothetical protein
MKCPINNLAFGKFGIHILSTVWYLFIMLHSKIALVYTNIAVNLSILKIIKVGKLNCSHGTRSIRYVMYMPELWSALKKLAYSNWWQVNNVNWLHSEGHIHWFWTLRSLDQFRSNINYWNEQRSAVERNGLNHNTCTHLGPLAELNNNLLFNYYTRREVKQNSKFSHLLFCSFCTGTELLICPILFPPIHAYNKYAYISNVGVTVIWTCMKKRGCVYCHHLLHY